MQWSILPFLYIQLQENLAQTRSSLSILWGEKRKQVVDFVFHDHGGQSWKISVIGRWRYPFINLLRNDALWRCEARSVVRIDQAGKSFGSIMSNSDMTCIISGYTIISNVQMALITTIFDCQLTNPVLYLHQSGLLFFAVSATIISSSFRSNYKRSSI